MGLMKISCRQLLEEPSMKAITLVSGEAGLDRHIEWIYMAENFNNYVQPKDWLTGNELIFVNGNNVGKNTQELIDLIKSLDAANAAGIIIMLGPFIHEIPIEVAQYCDQIAFPLFTIPWEVKIVEFSYALAQLIIKNDQVPDALSKLSEMLQYGSTDEIEKVILLLEQTYRISLQANCSICVMATTLTIGSPNISTEAINGANLHEIYRITKEYFRKAGIPAVIVPVPRRIVLFLPNGKNYRARLTNLINDINSSIRLKFKETGVCAGIGGNYTDVSKIKLVYREALDACKVALCTNNYIHFYDELGIYKLIIEVMHNEDLVNQFFSETLQPLIVYDTQNGSNLFATLETYFYRNLSMDASANLFIHKNTLKYRLNKIEEILRCDLGNIEDLVNISTCFKIHHLRKHDNLL